MATIFSSHISFRVLIILRHFLYSETKESVRMSDNGRPLNLHHFNGQDTDLALENRDRVGHSKIIWYGTFCAAG